MGRTIVVGIEDRATASIVAVEAAHMALHEGATEMILLHVLDEHAVVAAMFSASGYPAQVEEPTEEGERTLALAEAALRAECSAMGRAAPAIRHQIDSGSPAAALERAVASSGAISLVLGARRPHAFGRLMHPDVGAHLANHVTCPIHIAALQADPAPQEARR